MSPNESVNKNTLSSNTWILFPQKLRPLVSWLNSNGFEEKTNTIKNFRQVIYFSNDHYPLPFGLSLKATRTVQEPENVLSIVVGSEYIFGLYLDAYLQIENRMEGSSELLDGYEIIKHISEEDLGSLLRNMYMPSYTHVLDTFSDVQVSPQMGAQFRRRVFTLNNEQDNCKLRVTVDQDVQYFAFDFSTKVGFMLDEIQPLIIELRSNCRDTHSDHIQAFSQKMEALGAYPSIPQKYMIMNKLSLSRRIGAQKLRTDKTTKGHRVSLLLTEFDPGIMFMLLRDLFESSIDDFRIGSEYLTSNERGEIEKDYKKDGSTQKVILAGDVLKIKGEKDQTEKLSAKGGFRHLEPDNNLIEDLGKEVETTNRIWKTFWVIDRDSNHVYKISAETRFNDKETKNIIHLEYAGTLSSDEDKARPATIAKNLEYLRDQILQNKLLAGFFEEI